MPDSSSNTNTTGIVRSRWKVRYKTIHRLQKNVWGIKRVHDKFHLNKWRRGYIKFGPRRWEAPIPATNQLANYGGFKGPVKGRGTYFDWSWKLRRRRPVRASFRRARFKRIVYNEERRAKAAFLSWYPGLKDSQLKRLLRSNRDEVPVKLEQRLDAVLIRTGFAPDPNTLKQWISHGVFEVNGVRSNSRGHILRPGDIVSVHDKMRPTVQRHFSQRCLGQPWRSHYVQNNFGLFRPKHQSPIRVSGSSLWLNRAHTKPIKDQFWGIGHNMTSSGKRVSQRSQLRHFISGLPSLMQLFYSPDMLYLRGPSHARRGGHSYLGRTLFKFRKPDWFIRNWRRNPRYNFSFLPCKPGHAPPTSQNRWRSRGRSNQKLLSKWVNKRRMPKPIVWRKFNPHWKHLKCIQHSKKSFMLWLSKGTSSLRLPHRTKLSDYNSYISSLVGQYGPGQNYRTRSNNSILGRSSSYINDPFYWALRSHTSKAPLQLNNPGYNRAKRFKVWDSGYKNTLSNRKSRSMYVLNWLYSTAGFGSYSRAARAINMRVSESRSVTTLPFILRGSNWSLRRQWANHSKAFFNRSADDYFSRYWKQHSHATLPNDGEGGNSPSLQRYVNKYEIQKFSRNLIRFYFARRRPWPFGRPWPWWMPILHPIYHNPRALRVADLIPRRLGPSMWFDSRTPKYLEVNYNTFEVVLIRTPVSEELTYPQAYKPSIVSRASFRR